MPSSAGDARPGRYVKLAVLTTVLFTMLTAADARAAAPGFGSQASQRDGGLAATATVEALQSVSCVSATFCVAGSANGAVLSSTTPTSGIDDWQARRIASGAQFRAISCPSTSLCVIADLNGNLRVSTNPTGPASTWTSLRKVDGPGSTMTSVSCASASLCVAVNWNGAVLTSTNPAGGAAAWQVSDISNNALEVVSCPSASLCVVGDVAGSVYTATNPTGGAGAWTAASVDPGSAFKGLDCPTTTLCVATTAAHTLTSTDPTGGADDWDAGGSAQGDVSCASPTLCAAVAFDDVWTSADPPSAAWTSASIDNATHDGTSAQLQAISCPSMTFCLTVDDQGNAVTTTNPTGGASAWTLKQVFDGSASVDEPDSGSDGSDNPDSGSDGSDGGGDSSSDPPAVVDGTLVAAPLPASPPNGSEAPPAAVALAEASMPAARGGNTVRVRFSCAGAASSTCAIRIELTAIVRVRAGRVVGVAATARMKPKARRRSLTVGTRTVVLSGGDSKAVVVRLNAAGRRVLRKYRRLTVSVRATQSAVGARRVLTSRSVTLTSPRRRGGGRS